MYIFITEYILLLRALYVYEVNLVEILSIVHNLFSLTTSTVIWWY